MATNKGLRINRPGKSLAERFEKMTIPEPNSGCILWLGALSRGGYGRTNIGSRRNVLVHRAAYEDARGPIPDGLTIDHLCRLRSCVNSDHMEAVTMRENVLRGTGPSAANAKKTVCLKGHPLEVHGRQRRCGPCYRQSDRQSKRRAYAAGS
jgi:hypothetical protein